MRENCMKYTMAWLLCITLMPIHSCAAEFVLPAIGLASAFTYFLRGRYTTPEYADLVEQYVVADNIPRVQEALGMGILTHVDTLTSRGHTPLMYARSEAMVDELMSRGADVNFETSQETPLSIAVSRQNPQIPVIKALLNHKANINAQNNVDDQTVLFRALNQNKPVPIIKLLLEKKADPNKKETSGVSPLMIAALRNKEYAALLLEHKADINATEDNYGSTPLNYAVVSNNPSKEGIIDLLLEHKADINLVGPCSLPCYKKDNRTPLMEAAQKNDQKMVRKLIEAKALIDAPNRSGQTALMRIARQIKINKPMFDLLLEHKADINHQDEDGYTALIFVAKHLYSDSVKTLLEHKANPTLCNNNRKKALYFARGKSKDLIEKAIAEWTGKTDAPKPYSLPTEEEPQKAGDGEKVAIVIKK
jgi:ankyrin repeat protein